MGVMCSLLGHDYDDPEVERERDENGDEVVLTAKRVQRCSSCDHERTISENTEVTALSAAAGVVRDANGTVVVPDEPGAEPASDDPETETGSRNDETPGIGVDTDSETTRRADDGAQSTEPTDDASPDPSPEGSDSSADPQPGGVIAQSVTAESALGDPTNGSVRASIDEASSDGAGIDRIGDEPSRRDPEQRAPGEWPAEPAGRSTPTVGSGTSTDGGTSAAWPGETGPADSDGAVGGRTNGGADDGTTRIAGGSFVCGSCGFDAAVADSPLRVGDICPDCHRGYLAWETRKG